MQITAGSDTHTPFVCDSLWAKEKKEVFAIFEKSASKAKAIIYYGKCEKVRNAVSLSEYYVRGVNNVLFSCSFPVSRAKERGREGLTDLDAHIVLCFCPWFLESVKILKILTN